MAESSTLRTILAPFFGMNFSVLTASVADLPRIVSTTKRHFCGEMRAYLKTALVCMPYSAADTFLSPECALNVRVGANSPSLWPTMFSDTSTGTCRRPLCTAMVKPTISGMTMERRDQVLIGRRSFFWLAVCTFLARCKSTNGPFLSERGIISPTAVCSCGAERSCRQCACCGASSYPWSAGPTGSRDAGCPGLTYLRRRRADDRPGS